MPQLRRDRLTQEWVFVATESAKPEELVVKRARKAQPPLDAGCPLCPNPDEGRKAPELLHMPSIGGVGWPVRIVALRTPAPAVDAAATRARRLLRNEAEGLSLQELVVETPNHSLHTAQLPDVHLANVLRAVKARYDELSRDPRLAHISITKKHGAEAGAVFEHAHWQLMATDAVPAQVSGWLQHARQHYGKSGSCVFCVALQEELETQTRIVLAGDDFVALEPYASPTPFCTHVYPRRHMASFSEINAGEIQDLACILHGVFARFYHGLGDPDFHCILRTAPVANAGVKYYHWSFNIVPCFTAVAAPGGEACVNSVLPEAAAEFLRAVRVEQAIPA
jgi:UDPglucose--hexose-1-phosphate uridylyltransferase